MAILNDIRPLQFRAPRCAFVPHLNGTCRVIQLTKWMSSQKKRQIFLCSPSAAYAGAQGTAKLTHIFIPQMTKTRLNGIRSAACHASSLGSPAHSHAAANTAECLQESPVLLWAHILPSHPLVTYTFLQALLFFDMPGHIQLQLNSYIPKLTSAGTMDKVSALLPGDLFLFPLPVCSLSVFVVDLVYLSNSCRTSHNFT